MQHIYKRGNDHVINFQKSKIFAIRLRQSKTKSV